MLLSGLRGSCCPIVSSMKHDKMLDEYYELRQWDKATGLPTEQRLKSLGLEYTVDELRNAHARLK